MPVRKAKTKAGRRKCVSIEMHKLSTSSKKKKYPNPKQRIAIALSSCGIKKKKK